MTTKIITNNEKTTMGDVEAEDDVEEFPYLLKQLLQSGTKPEETVGCIDAFLAFSKRGCFACHHAGIEFSHFICDNPNCSASKNWCCHSCMVLRTTKKEKTYSEGWHCVGCDPLQQGKGKEFDVGSVTECRNVESKLVEQSFEPSGDSSLQSASGKCGPKSTDGPKRSKKQLLKKLIEIVTNDEYEKISFKGTYYDPNRLYEDHASKDYGTKQSIMAQLEDLSEAQLRLEIARYMHAKNTKLKESFIDTIRAEKTGEVGKKPDNAGKLPIKKIVYRLPLGPLEKLRSKLDQKTFILERAVELKSLMNGSSSSSGAAISSSEIEDLKSTIDQLKKQADNDREANEQDRAAEAAKMASLTEENRKIVKQNESLEDKTTRLEKENSDRQSDVHYLKSVVGDKESLIEQLQSQLFASDTRDHEIEAFKEAATTQQSLYLQEKANVDRMHDEYKALEEKHNETDQKLTTTRNENKALESENAALESKNAGLASTIDQLKMDMKAMMTGDRNNNGSEEEEEEGKDDDEEDEEEEADEKDGPKTWQEKCAEPGWTTNHSHVGKRVAKYFPCLAEGRKGECTLICRTSSFPRLPPISTLHFIMSNNPLSFSSFSIRSTKIVLRGSCQIPATF